MKEMRSAFLVAALVVVIALAITEIPAAGSDVKSKLRVWGATDRPAMEPILIAYEARHPSIDIEYTEFNTSELDAAVAQSHSDGPDLVISSAMDLQVRLVNRGLAAPITQLSDTPDWASWRNELFGFTAEPVVLIYNKAAFRNRALPETRSELASMLRDEPIFFDGRVGTYDISLSGVGYMFATQDAQRGYQSSRLVESLGRAHAKLYCCTSDMIDDVANGELVLAYNVMGSYASGRAMQDDRFGILFLDDYTLVFSRSVLMLKQARHKREAAGLINFLISPEGQGAVRSDPFLYPIVKNENALLQKSFQGGSALLPIRMGPGLLTWLDDRKKKDFLREWRTSIAGAQR